MSEVSSSINLAVHSVNILTIAFITIGVYRITRFAGVPSEKRLTTTLLMGGALVVWFVLALVLGAGGFFVTTATTYNPSIVLLVLPILVGWWALKNFETLRKVVDATPVHWIISIQLYRILGIAFILLYLQKLMPGEFAIPTGVGDILIGLSALPVAYFYLKKTPWARGLAVAWNVVGIADLVLAIILGVLTSPTPFQILARDVPNDLITQYPLVLVPVFAVPLSILLHLYALRILSQSQNLKKLK